MLAIPPLHAQTLPEVQRAAAESVERLGLQTKLPRTPEDSGARWSLFDKLRWPEFRLERGPLLWLSLILGAILILYAFRDQIPMWRGRDDKNWDKNADGSPKVAPQIMEDASLAADELARQGRHMEAMHLLLLWALAEIRQRLGEHFVDSMTSREILRRARLSDGGRASLREIITRVEWSYFGEHPAEQADYAICRDNFDRLIAALNQQGARA